MSKLDLQTPDFVAANAARLAELFPNCVTESRNGQTGEIKRSIDFDLLRQELAYDLVEGPQERYRLDWPGKREALALANAPIRKTLRPCKDESVDFETTQNLYIEGDNLDALKLLQETYLGKVKMIYIDPPYNTGSDFIYDDNFSMSRAEYQDKSGEVDEEGQSLFDEEKWKQNLSSDGRFHSEWLSMMYPRLKLARNLLEEGGVCLISCDDREEANLRKICDEIFGEVNRLDRGSMIWKSACSPRGFNHIVKDHEFILTYAKDLEKVDYDKTESSKADEIFDGQLWIARTAANPVCRIVFPAGIRCEGPDRTVIGAIGSGRTIIDIIGEMKVVNGRTAAPVTLEGSWPSKNQLMAFLAKKNDEAIYDTKDQKWVEVYFTASNFPFVSKIRGRTAIRSILDDCGNTGSPDLKSLGLDYSHPKPTALIEKLVSQFSKKNSLVLDFFAGSSTTAEVVMRVNGKDGGKRRFVMVQVPDKHELLSNEFKNIADVGKERIRRAGKKILEEWHAKQASSAETLKLDTETSGAAAPDIGFRVLKIDSSNMSDVYYQPDELTQDALALQVDNLKPGRKPEDLLFQVLLDWGVDLALPITEETILKRRVFFVADNALAACFDTGLDEDFVKELAKRQPMRAVFRDSGYASDAVKINFEQIFKALSPHTELKTL